MTGPISATVGVSGPDDGGPDADEEEATPIVAASEAEDEVDFSGFPSRMPFSQSRGRLAEDLPAQIGK